MPTDDYRTTAALSAQPGRRAELEELLAQRLAAFMATPNPVTRARALRRVDGEFEGTHFEELCGDRLEPFDVVIDVWTPDGKGVEELFADLGGAVDGLATTEGSFVAAGPQWRASKPPAPLIMQFCISGRPDMTHEQCIAYWRNNHAYIPLPTLGTFCQFYAEPGDSEALSSSAGLPAGSYDGISEPSYRDLEHFREITLDPRIRVGAREDEFNFLDHSRCSAVLLRPYLER